MAKSDRHPSVAYQRFETILFAAFGAVALLLACLEICGVIAYPVAQCTGEVSIRMAPGATRAMTVDPSVVLREE